MPFTITKDLVTQRFESAYNAWRCADFCAFSGISCKLWKEGGFWFVSY